MTTRRELMQLGSGGLLAALCGPTSGHSEQAGTPTSRRDLTITDLKITPIALPDPPILAASGAHGPYFLRNIVEITTADGIIGIGETKGGEDRTRDLTRFRDRIIGQSAFAYWQWRTPDEDDWDSGAYAGIELACLDAIGQATGLSLSQLLGGPVRDEVEFAAYLFWRFAADHPAVLSDPRLKDDRGLGDKALDQWGEVRTPEAMAEMAWQWHQRYGFTAMKLKAGVLEPEVELQTLEAINERFDGKAPLRIDPNGRWRMKTAIRLGEQMRQLPLEYYEDPVSGQEDMARVRRETGHVMSTNSCVTRFDHIPEAVVTKPIDVVLCDHHSWGGIPACQALGLMADVLGWKLSQHSNNHAGITMAAMVHVGALVPQLTYASDTHYPWLPEGADIIEGRNLMFHNGRMPVPTMPGVGVALDRDKLARAHETYQRCGMRERDDEGTMRRFVPGWERTLF